ncbi:uncharacterized protein LOC111440613 isoform X1 [Cucurbita moschata]|uniref:Uncharacterized protein LOC111440613 isoform X1 n=1 Tax=Cucurbita moschata TaxID=3662 RepID=A0A6J1F4G8_CUCMO|nr:uncharacterized protein LOC111440613 isoform X1 [Cucurbita moschata]
MLRDSSSHSLINPLPAARCHSSASHFPPTPPLAVAPPPPIFIIRYSCEAFALSRRSLSLLLLPFSLFVTLARHSCFSDSSSQEEAGFLSPRVFTVMLLLRRINVVRQPSSVFAHGFSESPLKSLRYLSTSSEIASSPKSASPDSNKVKPENDEKPVIVFFENHGFSKTQISELVKKFPQVLSANPEKTLLPKLLFFQSKGLSSPEIAKLVCGFPSILMRSLDRKIIPAFDYIQELLQTEEKTIASIKRFLGILTWDLQIYARPNVETLIQIGVPDSKIATILEYQPRVFLVNTVRFKEIVEEVKEMGFNPLRLNFVLAVFAMRAMSKSTWRKKVEVYKKWGWPEEEILSAFRRHPWCMMASEDKINGVMDFFVNKIGCEPSYIAKRPALISLSLKKRIVPRGSVYQVLLSKGLIKKDVNLPFLFESAENRFLDKFIDPHKELIPGLLKLYKEKLEDSKR